MGGSGRLVLVFVFGLLAWVAAFDNSLLLAQGSKLGLSPEDQKKLDELMQSARRNQTISAVLIPVSAGVLGLALLWGAYSTSRKGLQVSKGKRIEGPAATAVAAGLVFLALAVTIGGILLGSRAMP